MPTTCRLVLIGIAVVATLALGVGGSASPTEAQEPLSRIQGTVIDADGEPVSRMAIGLQGRGESEGENYRGATEDDGTFSFDVPDGTYRLVTTAAVSKCTATGYDNPDSEWEVTIAVEGQDITGIQVTFSGERSPAHTLVYCGFPDETLGHIRGTVTDPDGQPVADLWISGNVHRDPRGVYDGDTTASDGTFHLRLRHGIYWLHTHTDGYSECTVSGYGAPSAQVSAVFDTRAGEVAGLHVVVSGSSSESAVWSACNFDTPLPRIEGTVLGADGVPLEGISVRAFGELGNDNFGPWTGPDTGPDGTFSIETPDGSFAVQLFRTIEGVECSLGYVDAETGHTFSSPVNRTVISGEPATGLTVRLPSTPSALCRPITGIVTGSDGESLGVASVAADALGPLVGVGANGATSEDGTFTLYGQPGAYHVLLATRGGSRCTIAPSTDPEPGARARIQVGESGARGLRIVVSGEPSDTLLRFYCSVAPRMLTTELQPGWNLAGWTGSEADASELFGAIPGLEVVHAWDAEEERFLTAAAGVPDEVRDLRTLTPGIGLWLYLGGTDPVEWTRPFLPESGFVTLAEGWNLVSWSGEDGLSVDEALGVLGAELKAAAAWDAASGRELHYFPAAPATESTLRQLSRGGALWIEVSAGRPWLQTGITATVEFGKEYSEARRTELRALVDTALAFYAHRFGVFVPGITVRYRDDHEQGCFYSTKTISLKERCWTAIGHEYGHAVQEHLAGPGSSPQWILEGVANRWSAQFHDARGFRTYADHLRDTVHPHARRTLTPLEDLEASLSDGGLTHNYNLIHVAIDYLVELVGEDRTFQYYRERANYRTWQDAFHGTFGLSVDDFYTDFAEYREANFAPFEAIQGVAVTSGGEPLGGLWLGAFPPGESGYLGASTAGDGTFTLRVPDGAYRLELHTDVASTCTVSGYESAVAGREAIIRVDGEGASGVRILAGGLPGDEAVWIPCTFAE